MCWPSSDHPMFEFQIFHEFQICIQDEELLFKTKQKTNFYFKEERRRRRRVKVKVCVLKAFTVTFRHSLDTLFVIF